MSFLESAILFYPFVAVFTIPSVALTFALFLSLWAGRKLFAELAHKNRIAAGTIAFTWYIILFLYFSPLFAGLEFVLLSAIGVPDEALFGIAVGMGIYLLFLSLPFFIVGAASLFLFIRKHKPQSVEVAVSVSWIRALWRGTRKSLLFAILPIFISIAIGQWLEYRTSYRGSAFEKGREASPQEIEEQIAKIRATKLTLDDVMGTNLPPVPDPVLADATIEGVDANQNGIRDDVELAIFEAYPDSARMRLPLLQYAQALQSQMTLSVVNSKTVTETVANNESRANVCLRQFASKESPEKFLADIRNYREFVESKQFNTEERRLYYDGLFKENLESFSASNEGCYIDFQSLPN